MGQVECDRIALYGDATDLPSEAARVLGQRSYGPLECYVVAWRRDMIAICPVTAQFIERADHDLAAFAICRDLAREFGRLERKAA